MKYHSIRKLTEDELAFAVSQRMQGAEWLPVSNMNPIQVLCARGDAVVQSSHIIRCRDRYAWLSYEREVSERIAELEHWRDHP